eukprot:274424_1
MSSLPNTTIPVNYSDSEHNTCDYVMSKPSKKPTLDTIHSMKLYDITPTQSRRNSVNLESNKLSDKLDIDIIEDDIIITNDSKTSKVVTPHTPLLLDDSIMNYQLAGLKIKQCGKKNDEIKIQKQNSE